MNPRLLRVLGTLRHGDTARIDELFPAARRMAMLDAILTGEPAAAHSRRRRRRIPRPLMARVALAACAVLVACVLAAVVVALTATHTREPNPGGRVIHAVPVAFRYPARGPDSDDIVATVTDPFAAQSSLDAAFRAAGLDITVTLVPASPSAVGTVVEISEPSSGPQIETLTGGACVTGGGGPGACPIGLKIPRAFTGSGSITLGRPARPGEAYESTNSAFAPGESLHCSGLIGATVAAALPALAARSIAVQWQHQQPASAPPARQSTTVTATATSTTTPAASAGAAVQRAARTAGTQASDTSPSSPGYHVVDATPIRSGVVMLETQPGPLSSAELAQASRAYSAGC